MINTRIKYIDYVRGLAMLFVVYGHINFFSFEITPFINSLTASIQMPLFFFISGYVAYKNNWSSSLIDVLKSLWSKFCYLIVPTMIMGILYSHFVLDKSICDFITEEMKYGYWFPISLFTMFMIYELSRFISKSRVKVLIILLITLGCILWCSKYVLFNNNTTLIALKNCFSLWQTFTYFPFFILGIILCVYREYYEKSLSGKGGLSTVLLITFILAVFLSSIDLPNIKFPLGGILSLMIGSSGTLLILNLFIKYKSYWNNSFIGRLLQTIGRRTLEIYLLHYFILPDLTYAAEYVNTSSTIVGFAISLIISMLIIASSLIIGNIIRLSPILSVWLLGVKIKK